MTCMTNFSDAVPPSIPLHVSGGPAPASVKMRVATLLPLLLDAVLNERAWIDDFADDEISVSSDLYEVLKLYAHRRKAA